MFSKLFKNNTKDSRVGDVDAFFDECLAELEEKNTELMDNYSLAEYERWDFDQETAELVFSNQGKKGLIARVYYIGSYSPRSETWMWGWGNDSVMPYLTAPIARVREFGHEQNIEELVDRFWSATEDAGWAMSAAALRIVGGLGVYRGKDQYGESYLLIHDICRVGNS